ncbi:MAG: DUF1573 domain-containing protein [Candidatus Hydrogenedentes bacterium]|nr:DUF1573 domain-containing protein [Candidatus Hydrogenedentota bacterium]
MLFTKRCAVAGGLMVALGSTLLSGAYGESVDGPKLVVSATEINLGVVKAVDGIERVVEVRNTGTDTLVINPITALCTCVEVSTDSLEVEPGATGSFVLRAMLATYPSNEVKGNVRLYTNDGLQPEVDITVRAKIVPEYVIEPVKLDFGRLKAGESAVRSFEVRQNGDKALRVDRVEASKGLTATLEEIRPKKGEPKDQPRCYAVTVTLEPGITLGAFRGTVVVFTNCARIPKAEVKVSAQIAGLEYTVTPKVLAFGTASPGDTLGAFVVEGKGIAVTEAQADNAGLMLKVYKVVAGKRYRVEAIAGKSAAAGRLLSMVTLRIGDGALSEEVRVRVFGRVEQKRD